MRKIWGYVPLILVGIFGLVILIIAYPVSKWLAERNISHNGVVVGRIVHAEGSVRRIHGSDIEVIKSPMDKIFELRDGDRVQTSVESRATIILTSQDEFELPSGSAVQFQLWSPNNPTSPIYVHILFGKLSL